MALLPGEPPYARRPNVIVDCPKYRPARAETDFVSPGVADESARRGHARVSCEIAPPAFAGLFRAYSCGCAGESGLRCWIPRCEHRLQVHPEDGYVRRQVPPNSIVPSNPQSSAFHHRQEFIEIGRMKTTDGCYVALLRSGASRFCSFTSTESGPLRRRAWPKNNMPPPRRKCCGATKSASTTPPDRPIKPGGILHSLHSTQQLKVRERRPPALRVVWREMTTPDARSAAGILASEARRVGSQLSPPPPANPKERPIAPTLSSVTLPFVKITKKASAASSVSVRPLRGQRATVRLNPDPARIP